METPLAVLCYFYPRTKKRVKCKQRSRKHTHPTHKEKRERVQKTNKQTKNIPRPLSDKA